MPLAAVAVACAIAFLVAFRVYGRFVASRYGLDDARVTPAVARNDGVDFVPTRRPILLAQHFASIAAAGPVVGPITAGLAPSSRDQYWYEIIATRGADGASSSGSSVRPSAAPTPSIRK